MLGYLVPGGLKSDPEAPDEASLNWSVTRQTGFARTKMSGYSETADEYQMIEPPG